MNNLRQITKVILNPKELKAVCITQKGAHLAVAIELTKRPDVQLLVNDFSRKLLDLLEEEVK